MEKTGKKRAIVRELLSLKSPFPFETRGSTSTSPSTLIESRDPTSASPLTLIKPDTNTTGIHTHSKRYFRAKKRLDKQLVSSSKLKSIAKAPKRNTVVARIA